jgi:hypothetical protein
MIFTSYFILIYYTMSNSSLSKCINLYGQNTQNLGLYDTVKKDVFQKLRTSENDDAHIKLCLNIAKQSRKNFNKINYKTTKYFTTSKSKYLSMGKSFSKAYNFNKRVAYALENGAFFIDDMYNGKMGSKAITINEYKSLTPSLKDKARPVVPGDEISYTGAFGMESASHHGIYMGTNSKDKIGLTIEVDGMFPTLSHSEFFYTLIMMSAIGGGAGLIRCYRNLNEFTFKKDIATDFKHDTTDNDSTIIYEDEFTSNRNMILAESHNLDPKYIYETLNRAVNGLICKIWEYNPITSNCEHFAKLCVTRKFETLQGMTQNILTGSNIVGIASSILTSDASKVPDLVTILNFYNTNSEVLKKALDDISSGNEIKNKAQFTNTLKALVLIIQDDKNGNVSSDTESEIPSAATATTLLIKKEAFKLLKKLHTYEINRPREKRLITDESVTIMDDLFSAINEVSDEDINEPSILMSTLSAFNKKFEDIVDKNMKESGIRIDVIKRLLDFSNIGGNLNLPFLNPIGIGAIEVEKFDDLSETFIGELLATRGGRRKYKHRKTKKIKRKQNKKTKRNIKRKQNKKTKRNIKTKRNKPNRYTRR